MVIAHSCPNAMYVFRSAYLPILMHSIQGLQSLWFMSFREDDKGKKGERQPQIQLIVPALSSDAVIVCCSPGDHMMCSSSLFRAASKWTAHPSTLRATCELANTYLTHQPFVVALLVITQSMLYNGGMVTALKLAMRGSRRQILRKNLSRDKRTMKAEAGIRLGITLVIGSGV